AGGRMIAEVESDEGDTRLDHAPGQEGLLAPQMFAVAVAHLLRLAREIEGLPSPRADDHVHGLLAIAVHRRHRAGDVDLPAQAVERPEQRAPIADAVDGDALWQPKQVGAGPLAGVEAEFGVDWQ